MSTTAIKRKADDQPSSEMKKVKNTSITSFFGQPKPVSSTGATSASNPAVSAAKKFDKDAWIAKLTDEQKELLKLEIETLHESWLPYLADELTTNSFLDLKRFLKKEGEEGIKIFPPMDDVYSWYAPLANISSS